MSHTADECPVSKFHDGGLQTALCRRCCSQLAGRNDDESTCETNNTLIATEVRGLTMVNTSTLSMTDELNIPGWNYQASIR